MIGKSFSKAFKKTKNLVRVCDLFSTTELLRYKQNPQYKSANGGLCSIAVIIGFSIIFTQTILNTFDKVSISSQTSLFEETDPTYFTTSDSPFLFAVGLSGYNLNDPSHKYFNIELSQKSTINGKKATKTYQLIPCNRTVWSSFDASLGSAFDTIGLSSWLCLPSTISFQFTGKYTSNIFQYMKISVKSCSILAGQNRTCVNDSYIDSNITSNGPISFNYYFVNTIINPDSSDYLGFYLEDRNYFQFTKTIGTSANIFISTYSIETDESLWPWASINQDKGGIVHQATQRYMYSPTTSKNITEYVTLYVRKSSLSLSITRSFKKYDDTLSYIGGLFSTFMAAMIIMMKYNEYSYEIEIASNIYDYSKARTIKNNRFNFLSYVAYSFYCILDFLGIAPNWTIMRHFDEVREEIGKQLDLRLLLRKISFLEDCIGYVFEDYELQCLHLKGKMTLKEAEVIRKRFSSRKQVMKIKKKIEKKEKQLENPDKAVDNQVIIDNKVHNALEQSSGSYQSQRLQKNRGSRMVFPVLPELPRRQEEDQSSEEQEENDEKKLLRQYIASINQLKEQARNGNSRCQKIYRNLDKLVQSLPNCLPCTELNDTKANLNETQEKLQVGIRSSKKDIQLLEIRNVQE